MKQLNLNLSRISKYIFIISFVIAIAYFAQQILIPLAFSLFLALWLYPICSFFEKKISRLFSIILAFILVMLVFVGIAYFFGSQFYALFENIKDFGKNIEVLIDKLVLAVDQSFLNGKINFDKIVEQESQKIIGESNIIEKTIMTSTGLITSGVLCFIYTFLFLLYRSSFKQLILYHFSSDTKKKASNVLYRIQTVAQSYFVGLFIIILILGTLNGLGLLIIGLDYPFLFGFFAAFLAIIPYIGTFIGGLLPFLYALINENIWSALFVIIWYMIVQGIEGNILTPKIVGSRVSLNPLIALIAILTGSLIWGVAGMILFIPFMAILKVIFDHIDVLKPYGYMLGSDFGNNKISELNSFKRKKK